MSVGCPISSCGVSDDSCTVFLLHVGLPQYRGKRAKLIACDGNQIDTVFVDRRVSETDRGKKL
ncbi:hypothetical protein chiPu_0029367, partial [Chiloscyllium punctatum]|nr:hypothetical protein [Chiloscyllium punctatum]